MTGRILTPAEMRAERVLIETSAEGMAPFAVGHPWRITDPYAPLPWRVTAKIGALVRVERFTDERAAVIGHAQIVADVILLAQRAA